MRPSFLFIVALFALAGSDAASISDDQPPSLLPSDWESDWTSDDIWLHLDCDGIFETTRPIHSNETWVMLRNTYRNLVGPEASSISPSDETNGFKVPYKALIAPGNKGRGVFAAAPIKKGSLVWTSHKHQSAQFHDGDAYRQFLGALPADLACDVIQWAYVEDLGTANFPKLTICVDLDEGTLVNTQWYDTDPENNIGCVLEQSDKYPGGCKENLFALRDIDAGEEFLVDYGDFAIEEGWKEFGLQ